MKNKRSKGFVLETMETLNKSYKGNEKEKKQAMMFLNNATEVGNKVFCFIPVELLKIDHENYQRPLQKTFKYLLDNWDDDKCDPITVNYRGDGYFYVINGQHRTEAAKAMGIEQLCCDVFVGLTLPEEAELFVGQYDGSKKPNPIDSYRANVLRGEMIDTLIKEVCDKYGISVTDNKAPKTLGSLTVIRRIVKPSKNADDKTKAAKENVKIVDWIFSILEDSDWGHHKDTYNADIMQSLWYVNRNTQDSLQTSKNKLVAFFKNSTPKEIKALGNIEYPECGHGGGIYRIMLDIINDKALASV